MRLAYLCADRGIPLAGNKGASVHVRAVAQALSEQGHRVQVVALRVDGELPPCFRPDVLEVPFDRTLKNLRSSIDGDGRSVLSGEIHGLLLNSCCHDGLVEIEAGGRIDGVYERYSLWSVAGLRFARSRDIPFVLEVNAPLVQEQLEYRDLELRAAAEGIERFLFSEADAIFVPTRELAAYVESRVGGRRRIHVTPNGIHTQQFVGPRPLQDEPSQAADDRFTVVFLGSLKPWHGVGILLRAFEELRDRIPNATLRVIGHGPLTSLVEALEARLGSEWVQIVGEVPHHEVPEYLTQADVGVAPYPMLDNFYFSPMKVIEYMAAGLPVVASSLGQLRELIDHGETGLLVPPGDRSSLADALATLALDRKKRIKMGHKAQSRALRRHSWQAVAKRIERVFDRLSDKSSSRKVRSYRATVVRTGGGLV